MFSETKQNKRIRVLKDEEYQQIYALPTLSREEQEWFFELTQQELSVLDTAATIETKIDAILQLGYFKAKQNFFTWTFNSVQSDFDYIRYRYFDSVITTKTTIGRKYNNQQWVLSLFGYALFSKEKHKTPLSDKITNTARLSTDPLFVFQEILTWFEEKKLVLAGYATLQDMISNALYTEQERISAIINAQLTDLEISSLLQLLEQQEGHFRVTLLKKEPKNFKPKAIYKEIENFNNYLPFINDSTKYRSLDSELLPNWSKDKGAVLKKLSNPRLDQSVNQFIEEKAKPLDKKIIEINEANDVSIDIDKIIRQLSSKSTEVYFLYLLNKKPEVQLYAEI